MNNKDSYKSAASGLSFPTVVFIVFLILKLTGLVNWSWWWIFSPIWISFGIVVLIFLIGVIVGVIRYLTEK